MLTTIILDFDGTLGDSQSLILKTIQQTIQTLRLPPQSDEACSSVIGLPLKEMFTTLIPMSEEMAEQCAETYRRLFDINNIPGSVPAFPGVVETLTELHRRGLKLTIASSRGKDTLPLLAKEIGIDSMLSLILSVNDVKNAKPHPEPVLLTLEKLGSKAEETLVVGDAVYDIMMGQRANTKTCAVSYGNGTREELAATQPDWIIDHFSQLLDIVKQENGETA